MYKVLIVEDHELTRQGLLFGLKKTGAVEFVGEAENGQEALEMLRSTLTQEQRPTLVLMDIGMPVMDGIQATKLLKESYPEIKVIMLTSLGERKLVLSAFEAGADGYCMKDIKVQRLSQVIELVCEGGVWLDPAIAGYLVKASPHLLAELEEDKDGQDGNDEQTPGKLAEETPQKRKKYNTELTSREKDVLRLIVEGMSNQQIADTLSISLFTVKNHVCNLILKLAVDDRTQAAVKAIRDELL